MMRWEAEALRRNPPRLAKGETMPDRPVYWLIWVLDDKTGKPYASRCCWDKVATPLEASQKAYGMVPSVNMRFYNLGHRLTGPTGARRRLTQIGQTWNTAVDDTYIEDATKEIKRRGITISGGLTTTDVAALNLYRDQGRSAVEAGAQRAMDILRED
jgi:hypothetical protein